MRFFRKVDNRLECLLCHNKCLFANGEVGLCRVNRAEDGSIINDAYKKPVSIAVDPIEKKPLYHFYPSSKTLSFGTFGCNYRCPFCQNWSISQRGYSGEEKATISADQIVEKAGKNGCKSISYTYNEPTVFYPFARVVAEKAKKLGFKNVFVTNGSFSKEVLKDMSGKADAMNIDLKGFNKKKYRDYLGGDLQKVLNNTIQAKKVGIWVEITTLIVPNFNSSEAEIKKIANFIYNKLGSQTPWHLSVFFPNYLFQSGKPTKLTTLKTAEYIAKVVV